MRERSFILVAGLLAVLFLGAGGLYLYDSNRNDQIAEGISVAGVDVGGMRADAARAKLRHELGTRLNQPIAVRGGGKHFTLSARRAGVAFNTERMIDDAVARSRRGSIFTRAWRSIRGGSVEASLPAQVSYSQPSVGRFVHYVAKKLERKPQDASLSFASANDVGAVPGHDGLAVDEGALRRELFAILSTRAATHDVRVKTRKVKPKITREQLASNYPVVITVNRGGFRLNLFRKLKLVKTYRIAVGQAGLETPAGLYRIQDKQVNPSWHVPNSAWAGALAGKTIPPGPADPIKARWMGIFAGAGIHGTENVGSLGSAASHGCIRMAIPDVIELFDQVQVQTPVYIS